MADKKKKTKEDVDEVEKKEPEKSGIDMKAEDVLMPDPLCVVQFGKEEIKLEPMSPKTALFVSKFIAKNYSRLFQTEAFQKAKEDPNSTANEMWSNIVYEFVSTLDEDEIITLLSMIMRKDEKFTKENFSILGMLRLIRAFVHTEDFKGVFLEVEKIMAVMNE